MAVHALEACQYQGNPGRAERYIGRIAAGEFQAHDRQDEVDTLEQLLYLLLFFDVEPEVLLQFYRAYDAAARRAYPEALRAVATRAPGRIRIGYVSADLRDHVMGKMMWEAVSRHDRSRFEIVCYSIGDREDDWTRRYEAVCDRFERLARVDDAAAVERIAAADIDVLVDLNTHTKGARPAIFAAKPARVAIVHVASGGSLGLAAVDFKLTDALADPPENQAFLLERLLPMDGCVYPFRRIRAGEGDRCSRAALGIADGAFVIGAFVTLLKLSTRCLALWREILERIPEALIAWS